MSHTKELAKRLPTLKDSDLIDLAASLERRRTAITNACIKSSLRQRIEMIEAEQKRRAPAGWTSIDTSHD